MKQNIDFTPSNTTDFSVWMNGVIIHVTVKIVDVTLELPFFLTVNKTNLSSISVHCIAKVYVNSNFFTLLQLPPDAWALIVFFSGLLLRYLNRAFCFYSSPYPHYSPVLNPSVKFYGIKFKKIQFFSIDNMMWPGCSFQPPVDHAAVPSHTPDNYTGLL